MYFQNYAIIASLQYSGHIIMGLCNTTIQVYQDWSVIASEYVNNEKLSFPKHKKFKVWSLDQTKEFF